MKEYGTVLADYFTGTQADLKDKIKELKEGIIEGKATLLGEGEQGEQGTGEQPKQEQPKHVEADTREQAQKAFDTLFAFFKGNDEAINALTIALALLPSEQEQAEGEQAEGEQAEG